MPAAPAHSASAMPPEVPQSFFDELPADVAAPTKLPRALPEDVSRPTAPMRALMLYDTIIDDILTHPGTTIGDTCKRLQKGRSVISLVMRSDFFKARWLQRREQFNADMNFRITQKMASVVEKSLDITKAALETKGESIPLPILDSINKNLLDRLGYGPSASPGGGVNVQVNNTQGAPPAVAASSDGLQRAREFLHILERSNAASGPSPGQAPAGGGRDPSDVSAGAVVEGESVRIGETT